MRPNTPTLEDFDDWLRRLVKCAEFSMIVTPDKSETRTPSKPAKYVQRSTINAVTAHERPVTDSSDATVDDMATNNAALNSSYCCFVCGISPPHRIDDCTSFIAMTATERAEKVKESGRCMRCLTGRHWSRECRRTTNCQHEGCNGRHHTLLHGASMVYIAKPGRAVQNHSSQMVSSTALTDASICVFESDVRQPTVVISHKVLPVTLIGLDDKTVDTYAFLDNGSDATVIREDVADQLGLAGPHINFRYGTFNGQKTDVLARVVRFKLSALNNVSRPICVNKAYTIPSIHVPHREIDWSTEKHRWSHLADLDLHRVPPGDIAVLVGLDVIAAHEQIDIRKPNAPRISPVAVKTPLGWAVI